MEAEAKGIGFLTSTFWTGWAQASGERVTIQEGERDTGGDADPQILHYYDSFVR